jgi:hypothetical protein
LQAKQGLFFVQPLYNLSNLTLRGVVIGTAPPQLSQMLTLDKRVLPVLLDLLDLLETLAIQGKHRQD